jgi:hypothetical protein
LYNLSTDRAENRNLASMYPERVRKLEQLWTETANQLQQDALTK